MSGKHFATAAQGGIVYTRDEELHWKGKRFADRGKPFNLPDAASNVVAGLNLNLNELAAAVGRVQLAKLPSIVADRRRVGEGVKAGMIKLRLFRPFPVEEIKKAVGDTPVLGVMEKRVSFGAPASPLMEELMTAYYRDEEKPLMANYVVGLGGRDVSPDMIREAYASLEKIRETGKVDKLSTFIGVRGE